MTSDASRERRAPRGAVAALLASRWAPVGAGVLTGALVWWLWGSLRQVAVVHDEVANLLQAELFASGRWTAPGRPLPEFFDQFHVLVTPLLAPKYFPGHSLLMVPGVWLALPGLVPVLLNAVTGGLLFALARRVAGAGVALGAWAFWVTAAGNLYYRASYLSPVTTGALWLLGWWALLAWRETGRARWLVLLAGATGWCAITRPLTGLVFALPMAVVVPWLAIRRKAWRDLAVATAFGTALVAILPLWNARTTGDWRVTPYLLYSQTYFPFNVPGFGNHAPAPAHTGSPDLQLYAADFGRVHREHTIAAVPRTLWHRLRYITDNLFHGWRLLALPLALLGLWRLAAEVRFGLATAGIQVGAHLTMAHPSDWTAYYIEFYPVLAVLVGLGLARIGPALWPRRWAVLTLSLVVTLLVTRDLTRRRVGERQERAWAVRFAAMLRGISDPRAVVFVRFAPVFNYHHGYIMNTPDLERSRVWVVRDRGTENDRLLALAPDRKAYLFDQAKDTLVLMPRPAPRTRPAAP